MPGCATLRLAIRISGLEDIVGVYIVFNWKRKSGLFFIWGNSYICFFYGHPYHPNTPNTHMPLHTIHGIIKKHILVRINVMAFFVNQCGWGQYVPQHLASINPYFPNVYYLLICLHRISSLWTCLILAPPMSNTHIEIFLPYFLFGWTWEIYYICGRDPIFYVAFKY